MLTCAICRERLLSLIEDSSLVKNWMLDEASRHYR